MNISADKRNYW